jgi:hypothetical protein
MDRGGAMNTPLAELFPEWIHELDLDAPKHDARDGIVTH